MQFKLFEIQMIGERFDSVIRVSLRPTVLTPSPPFIPCSCLIKIEKATIVILQTSVTNECPFTRLLPCNSHTGFLCFSPDLLSGVDIYFVKLKACY
jgi:hypothetical protein